MDNPTTMHIVSQESISQISPIGENALKKWFIWLVGMILSGLPLLVVPIVKSVVNEGYNGWIEDIFGNSEIIMLSVSLAVASIFEVATTNQRKNAVFWFGVPLFLLTLICIFTYGIVTGITEYALLSGEGKSPDFELSWFNAIFLGIIFMLGTASFFSKKR